MSERQMCMMTFLKWNDMFSSVQSITENYEIYENNVIVTKTLKIKINNANELGPYPMGSEGYFLYTKSTGCHQTGVLPKSCKAFNEIKSLFGFL